MKPHVYTLSTDPMVWDCIEDYEERAIMWMPEPTGLAIDCVNCGYELTSEEHRECCGGM